MAVTINAKGTSVPTFTIGKQGITFNQGSSTPSMANNGDFWFNQSTQTLSTWDGSHWVAPTLGAYLPLTWPTTSGSSGQVLTTNGSGVLSWTTSSGSPGGLDTQIQYNSSGSFAGSSNLTYNATANQLTLNDPSASGNNIIFGFVNTGGTPGYISSSLVGLLLEGNSGNSNVLISGNVSINTNGVQRLSIGSNGAWEVGSSYGTSGQVLTSNGSLTPPTWQSVSGSGTVTDVSVTTANGFAGTVATSTTTPAITLSTTVTGILYGNGTSVAAAVAGNFPTLNQNTTGTAAIATTLTVTPNSSNTNYYVPFVSTNSGNATTYSDGNGNLRFDPGTGNLNSNTFTGNLVGNATSSTTAFNVAGGAAGSLVYQTGSGATTTLGLGTSGYVLTAGSTAPAYVNPSTLTVGSASTATSATTATNIAGGSANSVPYQTATSTTSFATSPSSGNVLTYNGTNVVWAAPATGGTVTSVSVVTANGVSGTVATATTTPAITLTLGAITPSSVNASGTITGSSFTGAGTGLTGTATALSIGGNAATATSATTATTATNANNIAIAATTTNASFYPTLVGGTSGNQALDIDTGFILNPSTGTLTVPGTITVTSGTITNLTTPVNTSDAATKGYVDAAIAGLSWKSPVTVATTANITLSGEQTIDGVLTSSSRVLVKNQSSAQQNGIYVSNASTWSRSADASTGTELVGAAVFVELGSTNAATAWVQTTDPVSIGTDSIVWAQFGAPGVYLAGTGLSLTGNTFANTGVLSITSNTGLSTNVSATGNVTITNTGVTSFTSGTGLSTNTSATGAVSVTNTGVTSNAAGTGISVSGATGAVTINNTGVTSLAGTTNQVIVSGSTGSVTLSLPQNINSGAAPTFVGTNFTGIPNSALTNSSVTIGTTSISLGGTSTTLAGLTSVTTAAVTTTTPTTAVQNSLAISSSGNNGQTVFAGDISITAGSSTSSGFRGGNIAITAGAAPTTNIGTANPATVTITGGAGSVSTTSTAGGAVIINGGPAGSGGGAGGGVNIAAAAATTSGTGGSVTISSGISPSGTAGSITLNTGTTSSAAALTINSNGAFGVGPSPSYGTSGQVLTSSGSTGSPTWTTISSSSGTVTSVAVSGSNGIGVSGSPITSSGTIALSLGAITPTSVNSSGTITGSSFTGAGTGLTNIPNSALTNSSITVTGGTGLGVSGSPVSLGGTLTLSNTGVTSLATAGTYAGALSISASTGALTIIPNVFTSTVPGVVPLSGGGTTNFLRADGTWATPSGTGSSVTITNATTGTSGTFYPLFTTTTSGTLSAADVMSTALTYVPATGALSATSFSGAGTGLTGTATSLSIGGNAATATTATNIAGGSANQIHYQTGTSSTGFIAAPTTSNTYLQWTGSAFTWATVSAGTVSVTDNAGASGTFYPTFVTTSGTGQTLEINKTGTILSYTAGTGSLNSASINVTGTTAPTNGIYQPNGSGTNLGFTSNSAESMTLSGGATAILTLFAGTSTATITTDQGSGIKIQPAAPTGSGTTPANITIQAAANSTTQGATNSGDISILGAQSLQPGPGSTASRGSNINITAGDGASSVTTTTGGGGSITITAGKSASGTGTGGAGSVSLTGGAGLTTGSQPGGSATIAGGAAVAGVAGSVNITGGSTSAAGGTAGSITIATGTLTTSGTAGSISFNTGTTASTLALTINSSGAIGTGASPSYGTAGQVLTSNGSTSVPSWSSPTGVVGFRNRIINGSMLIDQRNGNVSSIPLTTPTYLIDRWYGSTTGAALTGAIVAGTSPNQFAYRITGAASNTGVVFGQRIESYNIYDLVSSTVTLSCQMYNTSGAPTSVTWTAYSTSSLDNWPTTTGGTGNGTKTAISGATGTFTVSTTPTTFTASFSTGANITNGMAIEFSTGAFTSGTLSITDVQLEPGSTATTFERLPGGLILSLCQRYCYGLKSSGTTYSLGMSWINTATNPQAIINFPVTLRTVAGAVSSQFFSTAGNTYTYIGTTANTTTPVVAALGTNSMIISFVTTGATIGQAGSFYFNSGSGQFYISSEL